MSVAFFLFDKTGTSWNELKNYDFLQHIIFFKMMIEYIQLIYILDCIIELWIVFDLFLVDYCTQQRLWQEQMNKYFTGCPLQFPFTWCTGTRIYIYTLVNIYKNCSLSTVLVDIVYYGKMTLVMVSLKFNYIFIAKPLYIPPIAPIHHSPLWSN